MISKDIYWGLVNQKWRRIFTSMVNSFTYLWIKCTFASVFNPTKDFGTVMSRLRSPSLVRCEARSGEALWFLWFMWPSSGLVKHFPHGNYSRDGNCFSSPENGEGSVLFSNQVPVPMMSCGFTSDILKKMNELKKKKLQNGFHFPFKAKKLNHQSSI